MQCFRVGRGKETGLWDSHARTVTSNGFAWIRLLLQSQRKADCSTYDKRYSMARTTILAREETNIMFWRNIWQSGEEKEWGVRPCFSSWEPLGLVWLQFACYPISAYNITFWMISKGNYVTSAWRGESQAYGTPLRTRKALKNSLIF